jgi:hypothetical protein
VFFYFFLYKYIVGNDRLEALLKKTVLMMKRFKLAVINIDYIKYLHSFEPRIHLPIAIDDKIYSGKVPYIGIIYQIENVSYYAPLSSDKNGIFFNREKEKFNFDPDKINVFEPIILHNYTINKDFYVGSLRIGNAIPIINDCILDETFLNIINYKHKRFLVIQERMLSKRYNCIIDKTKNCIEGNVSSKEIDFCNDFITLEKAMSFFNPDGENQLINERIERVDKLLKLSKHLSPSEYQQKHSEIFNVKDFNDFFQKIEEQNHRNNDKEPQPKKRSGMSI